MKDFCDFVEKMNKFKINRDDKLNNIFDKIDSAKDINFSDLSVNEDLIVAVMNLISIEEHLFFTGAKTNKSKYYDVMKEVRDIRKILLKKILKKTEGETWCSSKHLLASSYRLVEVGTKLLDSGNKKEAYEFFNYAYTLYSLFCGINLELLPDEIEITNKTVGVVPELQNAANALLSDSKIEHKVIDASGQNKKKTIHRLKEVIKKIVDCCKE